MDAINTFYIQPPPKEREREKREKELSVQKLKQKYYKKTLIK